MKLKYIDKTNHPMYGKTHKAFALSKFSKPGSLNPMFNIKHSFPAFARAPCLCDRFRSRKGEVSYIKLGRQSKRLPFRYRVKGMEAEAI